MVKGFTKHDDEKPMMQLWPPRTLLSVGRVLTKGAKKYTPDNWRKVDNTGRYVGAAFRHLVAYMMGEKYDQDDGEHHLSHLICCAAFIVELDLEKADAEDFGNFKEAEDYAMGMIDGAITKLNDPLTHVVSKSEESDEKWADDVYPCGPWVDVGRPVRCERRIRDSIVLATVSAVVKPDRSWNVWAHDATNGVWGWERHPAEESIEAAKAAADARLRGD